MTAWMHAASIPCSRPDWGARRTCVSGRRWRGSHFQADAEQPPPRLRAEFIVMRCRSVPLQTVQAAAQRSVDQDTYLSKKCRPGTRVPVAKNSRGVWRRPDDEYRNVPLAHAILSGPSLYPGLVRT